MAESSLQSLDRQTEHEPDPRYTFANERTFLAWVRTGLALIAGGLVAHQVIELRPAAVRLGVSVAAVILGGAIVLIAYRYWRVNTVALRTDSPLELSPALWLTTVLVVLLACVLVATLTVDWLTG